MALKSGSSPRALHSLVVIDAPDAIEHDRAAWPGHALPVSPPQLSGSCKSKETMPHLSANPVISPRVTTRHDFS
jgi:hypothetical protein